MILELGRGARWLDEWLQERLGRPYNLLLSIGLVGEVVERVRALPRALGSTGHEVQLIGLLLMELALLLHQVAVLSHHLEKHRGQGGWRRRGPEAPPPG